MVLMMVELSDLRGLFQHEQLHDWVVLQAPDSIPAVLSGEAALPVPHEFECKFVMKLQPGSSVSAACQERIQRMCRISDTAVELDLE